MMELDGDRTWMRMALDLAVQGQGHVEPNPMVGCVVTRDNVLIGQGCHKKFGGPHAELAALSSCDDPRGATVYVTLEPCCHYGKTPPCTDALVKAAVAKVVIASVDPFPAVAGKGIIALRTAGIEVVCGVLENEAIELNRPWLKRIKTGMPWVIAKWAMTLDGKIATSGGASQWISNKASRAIGHQIRGRVDGMIVGIGTALADDPLLTARPAGPRTAARIVLDSSARLPLESKLIQTIRQAPVVVVTGPGVDPIRAAALKNAGCEVLELEMSDLSDRFRELLLRLAERDFTNVLVEGGSRLLGAIHDARLIDEVHSFIAPRIIGGAGGLTPVAGTGVAEIAAGLDLECVKVQTLGTNVYVTGRSPNNFLQDTAKTGSSIQFPGVIE